MPPKKINRLSELSPKMVEEINRMINSIASMKSIQEEVFPHLDLLNKTINSLTRLAMYVEEEEYENTTNPERIAQIAKVAAETAEIEAFIAHCKPTTDLTLSSQKMKFGGKVLTSLHEKI